MPANTQTGFLSNRVFIVLIFYDWNRLNGYRREEMMQFYDNENLVSSIDVL